MRFDAAARHMVPRGATDWAIIIVPPTIVSLNALPPAEIR